MQLVEPDTKEQKPNIENSKSNTESLKPKYYTRKKPNDSKTTQEKS
jgi:hypothetical protein